MITRLSQVRLLYCLVSISFNLLAKAKRTGPSTPAPLLGLQHAANVPGRELSVCLDYKKPNAQRAVN